MHSAINQKRSVYIKCTRYIIFMRALSIRAVSQFDSSLLKRILYMRM